MTTLAWPANLYPSDSTHLLVGRTQSHRSPLSGAVQTLRLGGAVWRQELSFGALLPAEQAALEALLANLEGMGGRVALPMFHRRTPRGVATGTPLVAGADQGGKSLVTDGWTTSTTGILLAGDFIGVGGYLYMVTADADSDSGGAATLAISPPLRSAPVDNAEITVDSPTYTAMLADDAGGGVTQRRQLGNATLTFVEDPT